MNKSGVNLMLLFECCLTSAFSFLRKKGHLNVVETANSTISESVQSILGISSDQCGDLATTTLPLGLSMVDFDTSRYQYS